MDDEVSKGMREMDSPGFVRFSIKTENTEENIAVHDAFKEFCKAEADNNYTIGLRVLLKAYEEDYRFSILSEMINNMNEELTVLKNQIDGKKEEEEEDESSGVF